MPQLEEFVCNESLVTQLEIDIDITQLSKVKCPMKSKHRNFMADISEQALTISKAQAISEPTPQREKIKHMLIGSSKAVTATIRVLHQLGYADIRDWSPLLPSPNPGEVMSILIRSIAVQ
ncbi:hypothetical protein NIES4106_41240 [Fischerella sp. NIES-4106]|nr:hypothetical protein NIES4106_41240 [Fischerella sp. NIES-4106]